MNYKSKNYLKYQTKNPFKLFLIDKFANRVGTLIKQSGAKNILDVGCGEGLILQYLFAVDQTIEQRISGVDVSQSALAVARSNYPNIDFREANIMKLPFSDNEFELVFALEVLEHLPDPQSALKELWRVASKQIIISVPDEPIFSYLRMLSGQDILKLGKHIEHVNYWNRRSMSDFIGQNTTSKHYSVGASLPWLIAAIKKN